MRIGSQCLLHVLIYLWDGAGAAALFTCCAACKQPATALRRAEPKLSRSVVCRPGAGVAGEAAQASRPEAADNGASALAGGRELLTLGQLAVYSKQPARRRRHLNLDLPDTPCADDRVLKTEDLLHLASGSWAARLEVLQGCKADRIKIFFRALIPSAAIAASHPAAYATNLPQSFLLPIAEL